MGYRIKLPESEHLAIVALYDPASGDILHWHYFCADDAAQMPSPQALEREAADHAMRHAPAETRTTLEKASFVHVDRQTLIARGPFKVDTRTRSLIELSHD